MKLYLEFICRRGDIACTWVFTYNAPFCSSLWAVYLYPIKQGCLVVSKVFDFRNKKQRRENKFEIVSLENSIPIN